MNETDRNMRKHGTGDKASDKLLANLPLIILGAALALGMLRGWLL